MSIQSVELINDYEIDLNSGVFTKIKGNEEIMNYLTDEGPVEDESDIVTRDLAEACEELKLDLNTYLNEYNLIRIVEEDGSESFMTNLEIAPL